MLHEFCQHNKSKKIEQKRFQIINDSMQVKLVKKTQFAGLNSKHLYFHDGILLLPFEHGLLKILRKQKYKYKSNIHNKIHKKKFEFLSEESKAVRKCERLRILRTIYLQIQIYNQIINLFASFDEDKRF